MKITLTGATGFLGRHLAAALAAEGHTITALCRDTERARALLPVSVRIAAFDLEREPPPIAPADVLVHLAWPGLPRYRDAYHVREALPMSVRFLTHAVREGVGRLLVAGTCFEFGMQTGPLYTDAPTKPVIAYAVAKDRLRVALEALRVEQPYGLQWARVFYPYGPGQCATALLPSLDAAILRGDTEFLMSGGAQRRDFLPVAEAVRQLTVLAAPHEGPALLGTFNVCSGRPTSVRELVERRIVERGSAIRPRFEAFPYAEDEPMAFWGVPSGL